MEDKILNIKELGIYLKCSVSEIRKLVKNNAIAHFRIRQPLILSKRIY